MIIKDIYGNALKNLGKYQEAIDADDMTFSGNKNIREAIPAIRGIIKDEGFEIAEKKIRILRRGNHQEVTGLTVNEKVAVPRKIRKLIRAVKYQYSKNKKKAKWKGKKVSKKVLDGLDGWVKFTKRMAILYSVKSHGK